jgi:hypothetical protein
MRKLTHLLLAAGLVLGLASNATAGEFQPGSSPVSVVFGGLPAITFAAENGSEALVGMTDQLVSPFGHFIGIGNTVWSTVNFGPGTSLFTGVPLISNLKVTAVNDFGNVRDGFTTPSNPMSNGAKGQIGPTFGGHIRLSGVAIIQALGNVEVGINHVGGLMGETTNATIITIFNIIATNGPFVTESLVITKVTSNLISVPGNASSQQKTGVGFTMQPATDEFVRTFNTKGGFQSTAGSNGGGLAAENHTVTISGTNNLASGSKAGMVTVVAPLRIDVDAIAGVIPGSVSMTFTFVPEPGTVLLLVSGAVGLAVIGRRRMRK